MDAYGNPQPPQQPWQPQLGSTPYPQPYPMPPDPTAPSTGYTVARWLLVVVLALEATAMAWLSVLVSTARRLLPEMALAAIAPLVIAALSLVAATVLLARARRRTSRCLLASSVASAVAWLAAYFAYGAGNDAFAPANDMTGLGDALMYVFLLVPAFYSVFTQSAPPFAKQ